MQRCEHRTEARLLSVPFTTHPYLPYRLPTATQVAFRARKEEEQEPVMEEKPYEKEGGLAEKEGGCAVQ